MCYICNRYLFIIYSENKAHEQEAAHPDIFPGVAAFLFCLGAKLTIKKEKEKERKEPKERIIKRIEANIYFLFLFIIYIYILYIWEV